MRESMAGIGFVKFANCQDTDKEVPQQALRPDRTHQDTTQDSVDQPWLLPAFICFLCLPEPEFEKIINCPYKQNDT